jgi:hypothetical protein
MSPFVVYILLCAASTAPGDCDTRNAVDVVLGPEAGNEIMCGLQAQEMFAKTSIRPRDGEYVKISCVRRRPTMEGDRSGSVATIDLCACVFCEMGRGGRSEGSECLP